MSYAQTIAVMDVMLSEVRLAYGRLIRKPETHNCILRVPSLWAIVLCRTPATLYIMISCPRLKTLKPYFGNEVI